MRTSTGQNNNLGPKTLTSRVKDIQQVVTNSLALPIDKMLYMCIYVCEKITINIKMIAHISLSLLFATICICNHGKKVSNQWTKIFEI
jgi:hypothetical protein